MVDSPGQEGRPGSKAVKVTVRPLIRAWPPGFERELPAAPWMVVHCRPRQEIKTIACLERLGIPGLAFFEERLRRYARQGLQRGLVPLLGGYIFVGAGRQHRDAIFRTERVVAILDVDAPRRLVIDLRGLIDLIEHAGSLPLVIRPEIIPGKRITITRGTLSGCQGVVVRRKGNAELVVNIHMLGTSAALTVPADLAELLDSEG